MGKNGTTLCNFRFSKDTIETLDDIKIEGGFGDRTKTLVALINNRKLNQEKGNVKQDNFFLSSTMVFCVGVLRGNVILEILGGGLMLGYFLNNIKKP